MWRSRYDRSYTRAVQLMKAPSRVTHIRTHWAASRVLSREAEIGATLSYDPETGCANGAVGVAREVMALLHGGPLPDGCHVHHLCINPHCSMPSHLMVLTTAQHGNVHSLWRANQAGKDIALDEVDVDVVVAFERMVEIHRG